MRKARLPWSIAFLRFARSDKSGGASCKRCWGCLPRLSTKILPACKLSQRSAIKRRINSLLSVFWWAKISASWRSVSSSSLTLRRQKYEGRRQKETLRINAFAKRLLKERDLIKFALYYFSTYLKAGAVLPYGRAQRTSICIKAYKLSFCPLPSALCLSSVSLYLLLVLFAS